MRYIALTQVTPPLAQYNKMSTPPYTYTDIAVRSLTCYTAKRNSHAIQDHTVFSATRQR